MLVAYILLRMRDILCLNLLVREVEHSDEGGIKASCLHTVFKQEVVICR